MFELVIALDLHARDQLPGGHLVGDMNQVRNGAADTEVTAYEQVDPECRGEHQRLRNQRLRLPGGFEMFHDIPMQAGHDEFKQIFLLRQQLGTFFEELFRVVLQTAFEEVAL